MSEPFLLYGANGYTGELIARAAVQRGLRPILAGRNAQAISSLAHELGVEYRVFPLEDSAAVRAALTMAPIVLHCAGPFFQTAPPMVEACLHTGTHYLDITGEIAVFEKLAATNADARASGVMLLPGVGFDIVPSDCLAAHLKCRLPSANRLRLAIKITGGLSHGTALTALRMLYQDTLGIIRRNGRLIDVPFAWKSLEVDFGNGLQPCISFPWGDVSSAYYSTAIPNIETYFAVPPWTTIFLNSPRFTAWLLRRPRLHHYLHRRIETAPAGPDDKQRANGYGLIWGKAEDSAGASAECYIQTPESYSLTVETALTIVQRVLNGMVRTGFQTPSTLFGPDLILEIDGTSRDDL